MAIQDKFNKPNVIYKITSEINLGGGTLTIPSGCTLDFQGGCIKNGTVNGNGCLVQGDTSKCSATFNNVKYFSEGQQNALDAIVVDVDNRMDAFESGVNGSIAAIQETANNASSKADSAVSTANAATSTANQAISTANIAKEAVKTLEGLSNATTAMETLAGQVMQIEENKQNIASNKDDVDSKLSELGSTIGSHRIDLLLVKGVGHSSDNDRIKVDIKAGDTFYVASESEVSTFGHIIFGFHQDGSTEVVLANNVLVNSGYIKRTASDDIVSLGLYWTGEMATGDGTLTFKTLTNYASEVKDNEIKTNENILDLILQIEEKARIIDVPIITKTIQLSKGVGHSSDNDRIDCLINEGDEFELRCESPTDDIIHSEVYVQYDGEASTTSLGALYNGKSKLFIAKERITSVGFYVYGGFVTENTYIVCRLINNLEMLSYKADVISRNYDIDNIVDAIAFPRHGVNRFTFVHCSDTHGDATRHKNIIQYINNKDYIVGIFNTGDIQESNFTTSADWFINSLNDTDKLITLTIGNHEVGNSKNISLCGNNGEVFAKFIKPIKDKNGLITNGTNYWYRDFAVAKIRVISLYEYDNEDIENGGYKIQRGRRCLSQGQLDWFLNLLYNTPTDYAVLILTHQNPTINDTGLVVENNWAYSQVDLFPQNWISGNPLTEIIDAWINGSLMQKEWSYYGDASYLPKITANVDFSQRGKGEFIGWFFGHTHADAIGHITDYPNQHWFCVTCATAEDRHLTDDLPRIIGQKSEDAFNVVSVDRDNKAVYIVRVGSNMNNELKERTYIKVSY